LENAVITVTERPITIAGSNCEVTANAEQIPNTCIAMGLFILRGDEKTSPFSLENNLLISYLLIH
jgi:hypothetical protein